MKHLRRRDGLSCSKCGSTRDRPNQRYCRKCHNSYAKIWRAQFKLLHRHLIEKVAALESIAANLLAEQTEHRQRLLEQKKTTRRL